MFSLSLLLTTWEGANYAEWVHCVSVNTLFVIVTLKLFPRIVVASVVIWFFCRTTFWVWWKLMTHARMLNWITSSSMYQQIFNCSTVTVLRVCWLIFWKGNPIELWAFYPNFRPYIMQIMVLCTKLGCWADALGSVPATTRWKCLFPYRSRALPWPSQPVISCMLHMQTQESKSNMIGLPPSGSGCLHISVCLVAKSLFENHAICISHSNAYSVITHIDYSIQLI